MANNESLKNAKNKKDDEFYTEYADIEREMNAYLEFNPNIFKDKVVLLKKLKLFSQNNWPPGSVIASLPSSSFKE